MNEFKDLNYHQGFGNHFCSEAIPNSLPQVLNTPRNPPMDLFAEQLSGTSFTIPRAQMKRSWLYRILPSVTHGKLKKVTTNQFSHIVTDFTDKSRIEVVAEQLRWKKLK